VLVPIYPLVPQPTATAEQVVAGINRIMSRLKQPIFSLASESVGGTLAMFVAQHLSRIGSDLASRLQSLVLISSRLDCTVSHPEAETLEANEPRLATVGLCGHGHVQGRLKTFGWSLNTSQRCNDDGLRFVRLFSAMSPSVSSASLCDSK
jgi:hypothetical protein